MDLSLHTRDQGTVETMDRSWWKCTESAENGTIGRQGYNDCFLDVHGIIHIVYLEKGKTMNSQYYSELLYRFDAAIKAKLPHLAHKKILFHKDNAPAHKAVKR